MSESLTTTSYDPEGQPSPAPRQALTYIAAVTALVFGVGCALLGVFFIGANRTAEEAVETRDKANESRRLAEENEQKSRQLIGVVTSAKDLAETKADAAEQARRKAQDERDEARQKADAAVKTARAADSDRAEAQEKVRQARNEADVADGLRKQETERRREAIQQIAKLDVAHGTHLLDDGDLPQALLWYAEALRVANQEKLPEDAHRLRLAIALGKHPRPVQTWFLENAPTAIHLSPDGRQMLTATPATVHLWDTATGKPIGEAVKHDLGQVTFAAFAPDGKQVVIGDADPGGEKCHLQISDPATGKPAFPPLEHERPIVNVVFSSDGKRLLTVATDRGGEANLRAWDAVKGEAIGKSLDHVGSVVAYAFSADGREVLLAGGDRTVRRWNPVSGNLTGVTLDHTAAVRGAAFSPDRKRVVTASADHTARVWQVETGQAVTPPLRHTGIVTGAEFSADGRRVLTIGSDHAVGVWDAATGEVLGGRLRHGEAVTLARFSPDGRHVLTASADGRLRLWDANTGDEVLRVWQGGAVQHADFSPDGSIVLTLEGKAARLWDLTITEPPTSASADPAGLTWFSPDGKLMLRANGTTAQLAAVANNQPVGPALKHKYPVTRAAFSGDGKRVATLCNEQGGTDPEVLVQVWDTATGEEKGPAQSYLHPVTQLALSHDGRTALTAAFFNATETRLRFFETETGKTLGKEVLFSQPLARALFSSDGKLAVTVMGNIVKMWVPATSEQAGKGITHTARSTVTQIVFSPDGKRLLTGDSAGAVFIGEASTGEEVARLPDHPGAITFAAFSPDGKRVVTCCANKTVRVWDVAKGTPLTPPLPHEATALAALSPDGRWLATASGNRLRIWDAATGERVGPTLAHSHSAQAISYLAFTADGKLVTGAGDADDPRGRQTWNLGSDNRSLAELEELIRLLSGHRLDGVSVAALTADESKKSWENLKPRFPADFAASPERALAWARRGLDECERDKNWVGVIRHLDRLIAVEPGRIELYLRRAAAHKALHQSDKVIADYSRAIEQAKDRPDLWSARAAAYIELRQWDKAAADYHKAIELNANDPDLLAKRGRMYAELGQWDKAGADFTRAITLGHEDATVFRDQALARLGGGDAAGYKQVCGRMAKRFNNSRTAGQTVGWTCALAPDALPDLKTVLQHAERAQADNPKSAAHLITVAALLYRTGQFQPALQQLEKAQALRGPNDVPIDWVLMAMTQQRLGRSGDANMWLAKAAQAGQVSTAREGWTWQDRLELSLLQKEAEALVKAPKP
jgi:WD40 repeat protein/Tfp pilus assembly protein PilF